ncbi:Kinase-like protein [Mycena sanguinolenta]|uniref:Kinase-like protein n=1 Tax=Mycena sanguinolenta TaxID=230812 RepID=A0A8H7CWV6_9AGAR|nr:Kinase-like protein [Mycena sanguinolenta]
MPSDALIPWDPDARNKLTRINEAPSRWVGLIPVPVGRLWNPVYTKLGHDLGKKANRVAHSLGLGPHVVVKKIKASFGNGKERVQQLELLHTAVPPNLEKWCKKLMKYALPTESAITQAQVFKYIVDLVTLFPGLRLVLLRAKYLEHATSVPLISELWASTGIAPPDNEQKFWQNLAATALANGHISGLVEGARIAQLTTCEEGRLSIIEQLLVEYQCSGISTPPGPLCLRYLGGILSLPGFWLDMGRIHTDVARKLFSEMVAVLKDIGMDKLALGPLIEDEPTFDYDGLDFLATTILTGISAWFANLDPPDWMHQPWYESVKDFLQLLRQPRAAELVPVASRLAKDTFKDIFPTTYHEVELNAVVYGPAMPNVPDLEPENDSDSNAWSTLDQLSISEDNFDLQSDMSTEDYLAQDDSPQITRLSDPLLADGVSSQGDRAHVDLSQTDETNLSDSQNPTFNISTDNYAFCETEVSVQPPEPQITLLSLDSRSTTKFASRGVSSISPNLSAPTTGVTLPPTQAQAKKRTIVPSTLDSPPQQRPTGETIHAHTLRYLKDVVLSQSHLRGSNSSNSFDHEIVMGGMQRRERRSRNTESLEQVSSAPGLAGQTLQEIIEDDHASLADTISEILYSPDCEGAVLALQNDSDAVQAVIDIFQHVCDNDLLPTREATSRAYKLVGKMAKAYDKLPSSLFIDGVTQREEHMSFCGGFGDVFKAVYQAKPVALKHMRRFLGTDQRSMRKKFCHEALVWQRLRHPNIVPFIGIDTTSFPTSLCMVSPWMSNGTVLKYLSHISGNERQITVDRLIREITRGLEFLHEQHVVHVDDMGTACLTDFGLTVLSDVTASGSNYGAGSVRWMAPEALSPTMFKVAGSTRTPASDVYAFACLCVESYTGYPPFHDEFLYDAPVMLHVIDGGRPKRPTGVIPDHIWDIMNRCWEQDLTKRPTAQAITAELEMHTQIPVAELGNGPAITARQGLDYADESKMVMDTTNQNHPSTASLASEEEQYEAEVGSYRSTFVTAFWGGLTLAALTLAAMATS